MAFNLIQDVLDETSEIESPKSYFYWATLAAISAILKKNVWFDRFAHKVYPNLYVLLVGKSGIRKGAPVTFAKRLVREVGNTRLITGRNTIEGIIKELTLAYRNPISGIQYADGASFIVSPELAVLLYENPVAHTILTDWYDTDDHDPHGWPNMLKSNKEHIKDICITTLAASNLTNLHESMPKSIYAGGLIGRYCVVYEDKRRLKNSLIHKPIKTLNIQQHASYLRGLTQLKGPFDWENGENGIAAKRFDDWYNSLDPELGNDKTGSAERIHIKVLKTAMCLSLAKDTKLIVRLEDLEEAIEACARTAPQKVLEGKGKSEDAEGILLITSELMAAPGNSLTDTDILSKHNGDISATDLDRICTTLSRGNIVTVKYINGSTFITATPEFIAQYQRQAAAVQNFIKNNP